MQPFVFLAFGLSLCLDAPLIKQQMNVSCPLFRSFREWRLTRHLQWEVDNAVEIVHHHHLERGSQTPEEKLESDIKTVSI